MITYEIKHFELEEFQCKCCGAGFPAVKLVFFLENLRRAFDFPIRVNSGFRCEKHNAEVGGAKKSRHLLGCAADITPLFPKGSNTREWKSYVNTTLYEFKQMVWRMFNNEGWEVKEYETFMHVAVPRDETEHLWGGESILI